jgi:hypothetical protein
VPGCTTYCDEECFGRCEEDDDPCTCVRCNPEATAITSRCVAKPVAQPCQFVELYGDETFVGEWATLSAVVCNPGSCPGRYTWRVEQTGGAPTIEEREGEFYVEANTCTTVYPFARAAPDSRCGTADVRVEIESTGCHTPGRAAAFCTLTTTIGVGVRVVPQRTGSATDTIYLLPNDTESFVVYHPAPSNQTVWFTTADPSIAKLRISAEELATAVAANATAPTVIQIHGMDEGETLLQMRLGSAGGPLLCEWPISVGGSITFQFDQLPTYVPYPVPYGQSCTALRGQGFVCEDFQLDGLVDSEIGPLSIPGETMAVLDGVSPGLALFRVVVRGPDGQPMMNKLVVGLQLADDGELVANRMEITPALGGTTNAQGRMTGSIRLLQPNGFLEFDIPQWRLLFLAGRAAEKYVANPSLIDPEGIFERQEVPILDRVSNGHLVSVSKRVFTPGGGSTEAALAIRLPHISARAKALIEDALEGILGRIPVSVTDSGTWPTEYWQLDDFYVVPPFEIHSELWDPPGTRAIEWALHPRPMAEAIPLYPNDDLRALLSYLGILTYNPGHPDFVEDGDPIGGGALLLARTIAVEIAWGVIPLVGDGRDIAKEIWNWANGQEVDKLALLIAGVGLGGDLGQFGVPLVGAPANILAATAKGFLKAFPKVFRKTVQWCGGGWTGLRRFFRYAGHFTDHFNGVGDWINPVQYYEFVKKLVTQFVAMSEARIVKIGGATADEVANAVGKTVDILVDRGRRLKHEAAAGWTGFVRHGSGGAEAVKDLTTKFPAGAADDSLESVGEAIQKTYDEVLISAPDPRGIERLDNAIDSARGVLNPHLRDVVTPHIGPNGAFKSMEEFEALRFIKAENLRPDQVAAINAIRIAMGVPSIGEDLVKVVDLNSALAKLTGGDPNLTGFFMKKAHLGPVSTTDDMIGAVRLDYPGSPFDSAAPHVVIETKVSSAIQSQTRVPKNGGFSTGHPSEYVENLDYPNTGNGLIASRDGRLRGELRFPKDANGQSIAVPMDPEVTVMRFKNADGTPKTVTNSATNQSASDWVLKERVPGDPSQGFVWEPLL